jgi:hypothetical protein
METLVIGSSWYKIRNCNIQLSLRQIFPIFWYSLYVYVLRVNCSFQAFQLTLYIPVSTCPSLSVPYNTYCTPHWQRKVSTRGTLLSGKQTLQSTGTICIIQFSVLRILKLHVLCSETLSECCDNCCRRTWPHDSCSDRLMPCAVSHLV